MYFSYCERKDNKWMGLAALELAKENNGVLTSKYRVKHGCGRRHADGPSPAGIDKGSRAVAMFGSKIVDADQVNIFWVYLF